MADSQTRAGITLRIQIDNQNLAANRGHRSRQIDRRRGFANAALLICHGNNPRPPIRLGDGFQALIKKACNWFIYLIRHGKFP